MATTEHVSIQVDYMHICDYSFRGENGKPAIIGIFDRIQAANFPMAHPMISVAIQLRGQGGHKFPIKLVIESQHGEKAIDMPEGEITMSPDGSAFLNINLVNMQFKTAGRYSVVLISQGVVLASQTLTLIRVEAKKAASA